MSKTIRIATVKATGVRYIVQQLSIPKPGEVGRVHCWGEVVAHRGGETRHSGNKTFLADAVTVTEVAKTHALVEGLFQQHIAGLRSKGNVVTSNRKGTKYTNHGTQEQISARSEAVARVHARLAGLTFTGTNCTNALNPSVTDGGQRSLPESREDIVSKIMDQLTASGAKPAIRQEYSNGEFISSSLIVGTSFAAVADRALDLDGAQHVAFFDSDLGLWWRRGGCFD